jgi:membrane protease YdiL (CAAX protease family)
MLQTKAPAPAPPRTPHPVREIAVFLGITYGLALSIALALPHAGIAPLVSILVPVTAVALTVALTVPRGERRAVWAAVGLGRSGGTGLVVAVVGPVLIIGLSFAVAAALGVVRFPGPDDSLGATLGQVVLATAVFTVVFLGEEVGWRGFLLFRLAEVTSGRRAALLTGAFHAVFHLPLLVLTTTYQSAGNRWIVVPMVMVTLTMAGVWYGWLRLWSGSIWPVALSHSAFNNVVETVGGAAVATSPVAMAYVTTETGAATMVVVTAVAVYLLLRRAADFERARPPRHPGSNDPGPGPLLTERGKDRSEGDRA